MDTSSIKGGDEWVRAISEGINNSYGLIVLCSHAALQSRWVWKEILWAEEKKKRIVPVLLEDVIHDDAFFGLNSYQAVLLHQDYGHGMQDLLSALRSARATPSAPPKEVVARPAPDRRALELEYLDRLRFEELLHTEQYTPLAGMSQVTAPAPNQPRRRLQPVVMRSEFEHAPWSRDLERAQQTRRFENAVDELLALRRAVLLGEPGAGKTTTLWALARRLVDAALADPRAPIPLLIRLGKWTQLDQPLPDFIAGELGELGAHLPDLLREKRAALLLDGLNETPVAQREDKAGRVQALTTQHPELTAVITSRAQDYTPGVDLGFDRVSIVPLDPPASASS